MNTYTAEAKNIKISPRKMRLVVDGVKKMPIVSALAVLTTVNNRAGTPIKKVLESAVANAVHNGQVKKEDLFISEMFVGEGVMYKRYRFGSRGRVKPYKKRTSHIKVSLGVKESIKPVIAKKDEKGKEGVAKKK